jgi:hypothetical protein
MTARKAPSFSGQKNMSSLTRCTAMGDGTYQVLTLSQLAETISALSA